MRMVLEDGFELSRAWTELLNRLMNNCCASPKLMGICRFFSMSISTWICFWLRSDWDKSKTASMTSLTETKSGIASYFSAKIAFSVWIIRAARILSLAISLAIRVISSRSKFSACNFFCKNSLLICIAPKGWLISCAMEADKAPVELVLLAFNNEAIKVSRSVSSFLKASFSDSVCRPSKAKRSDQYPQIAIKDMVFIRICPKVKRISKRGNSSIERMGWSELSNMINRGTKKRASPTAAYWK